MRASEEFARHDATLLLLPLAHVCRHVRLACGGQEKKATTEETPAAEAAVKETEQFRAKHEADYRKEYVSLAGLFFLEPGREQSGERRRQRHRAAFARSGVDRNIRVEGHRREVRARSRRERHAEGAADRRRRST